MTNEKRDLDLKQLVLLTPKQVAERLQVSSDLVRAMCARGAIRARRVGTLWRIPEDSIAEFFSRGEVERPQDTRDPDVASESWSSASQLAPQRERQARIGRVVVDPDSSAAILERRRARRAAEALKAATQTDTNSRKSRVK